MLMKRMTARKSAHRRRGFTLVEVLISLVVLSIGLLGMAKLILVSSHSNDSAYMRSQATALAYEMLDNMRANAAAAEAHSYDTTLGTMPANPGSCVQPNSACSQTQLAQWDVYNWKQHLSAAVTYGALPSGTGSVVTSATTPVSATITVQWDDSAAQAAFQAAVGQAPTAGAAPLSVTLQSVLQ
jgi:type IV pilus assembly protein PilV